MGGWHLSASLGINLSFLSSDHRGSCTSLGTRNCAAVDTLSAADAEPSSVWWLQQQIICHNLGDISLYGMQVQKRRSKDSSKQVDLTAGDAVRQQLQSVGITHFQGYEDVQGAGAVVAILKDGNMIETAQEGGAFTGGPCGRSFCQLPVSLYAESMQSQSFFDFMLEWEKPCLLCTHI